MCVCVCVCEREQVKERERGREEGMRESLRQLALIDAVVYLIIPLRDWQGVCNGQPIPVNFKVCRLAVNLVQMGGR